MLFAVSALAARVAGAERMAQARKEVMESFMALIRLVSVVIIVVVGFVALLIL